MQGSCEAIASVLHVVLQTLPKTKIETASPGSSRAHMKGVEMNSLSRGFVVTLATVGALALAGVAYAMQFTSWGAAQKIDTINGNSPELNTTATDGCPIQSPDDLSLYIASSRAGGVGGLDIWVAHRASSNEPFGAPVNLGAPINTASDEFCPTPVRGGGLYFVSRKVVAGVTCGLGDIYFTRQNSVHGWSEPHHLGCAPAGPNSSLDEQGPSYVDAGGAPVLYFSSGRTGAQGGLVPGEIFVSARLADGSFGPAALVGALSGTTAAASPANDIQPNVRKDGLEVVFSSDRAGTLGSQDIWVATRASVHDLWSAPTNLGGNINTAASETRPSLSWHATQLLFGRTPGVETDGVTSPIPSDVYVSTRDNAHGH